MLTQTNGLLSESVNGLGLVESRNGKNYLRSYQTNILPI